MRRAHALAVIGIVTAAAVAAPVTTAMAAPAEATYNVVPYENVNVRKLPATAGAYLATLTAGKTYQAYCWTHGETVTDHGYTNDIWIGFADGYSSAVYFKGNEYANLPVSAQC
ncbi:SH3 domain-containing protein [Streptomyces sp. NPDC006314]|uniref:SH3 domain-containing protein n=1 Tax=Streptomyces sp. NPDC006314 TaxID=3154475 RepID=UPI0033A0F87F